MTRPAHVVVVGGGVIGAMSAYYLSRAGWAVTLIDQDRFGAACSHGNCGLICPSHVLPLAEPGAIKSALNALLRPGSALSIRLRWDVSLWTWLYRFARQCNYDAMLATGRALQPLLESSSRLYDELVQEESLDCEWQRRGLLYVYRTREAWEGYAQTDELLTSQFQLPARRLSAGELAEFEPALRPGLAGGWFYDHDAELRPDRLMAALRTALERRGVMIREQCALRGWRREGARAAAADTSCGVIEADAWVIATGAWTPLLGQQLGSRIPIQPGKGYSITLPRPSRCPAVPLIFPEHRVAVTPMASGYRIGSTMEFAGYDRSLGERRLQLLTSGAREYLDPPEGPIEQRWYGWRPMTYDGLPIIDRSAALENVWIAAGHNMIGMTLAPATGKLIAELLSESTPHVDPRPYRRR